MTVKTTAAAFPSQAWENHTARFDAYRGRTGAVVTVHGEIDAANADPLAEYVERCTAYCEWLVLDLGGLDFIGTAALPALHTIEDRCTNVGVTWTVVPSPAVSRVLGFWGSDRALPVSESLADALATVQNPRRRSQLVAL